MDHSNDRALAYALAIVVDVKALDDISGGLMTQVPSVQLTGDPLVPDMTLDK